MKLYFAFLVLLSLPISSFASSDNVCGVIRKFIKDPTYSPAPTTIEFVDGSMISNIDLHYGEEAFITASLTNGIRVCFQHFPSDFRSPYRFSSASK
jgi:hypothetical protein